jgi:hypothetical protein
MFLSNHFDEITMICIKLQVLINHLPLHLNRIIAFQTDKQQRKKIQKNSSSYYSRAIYLQLIPYYPTPFRHRRENYKQWSQSTRYPYSSGLQRNLYKSFQSFN